MSRKKFFVFVFLNLISVLLHANIQRQLSCERVADGALLFVTVDVSFENEYTPETIILEENWPEGSKIVWSSWNGQDIACRMSGGTFSWLIGWQDNRSTRGMMSYAIELPENLPRSVITPNGTVQCYNGTYSTKGDSTLLYDEDAPSSLGCEVTFTPGANTISLPCQMTEQNIRMLKKLAGDIYTYSPENNIPQKVSSLSELSAGTPVCIFIPEEQQDSHFMFEISPSDETMENSLIPVSGEWKKGWNFVGVTGTSEIERPETLYTIWTPAQWTHLPVIGNLQPGACYWIYKDLTP